MTCPHPGLRPVDRARFSDLYGRSKGLEQISYWGNMMFYRVRAVTEKGFLLPAQNFLANAVHSIPLLLVQMRWVNSIGVRWFLRQSGPMPQRALQIISGIGPGSKLVTSAAHIIEVERDIFGPSSEIYNSLLNYHLKSHFFNFCFSKAIRLKVNPLYLMIPGTVGCSFAFMLPVSTPPNSIAFASGHLMVKDMVSCFIR